MTVSQKEQEVESFLSGKLTQVDVSGIERELRNLWTKATDGERDVTRACSFNLVMLSTEPGTLQQCTDMLDEILSHHPGRAVLALYSQQEPRSIEAWVSARCHLQGTSKQICSEQITVSCQGAEPESLTSVVLPLLIPDLPVYLWWHSNDLHAHLLRTMVGCTRRVVIDSARKPFDPRYLGTLLAAVTKSTATTNGCIHISDLNWRRLEGWFRALGNVFDGFPLELEKLFQIEQITVECAKSRSGVQDGPSSQALLLLSWIASRLMWKPITATTGNNQFKFQFSSQDKKKIEAILVASEQKALNEGSIFSISCKFKDGTVLKSQLEDGKDRRFIVSSVVGKEEDSEHEGVEMEMAEAALMSRALETVSTDPIFEASMDMTKKLIEFVS